MNNAKKYALIPVDALSKLQLAAQLENIGPLAQATDYNKRLQSILSTSSTIPPDVRAREFGQLFNQFQNFKDSEFRRPVKLPLIDDAQQPGPPPVVVQPPQQASPLAPQIQYAEAQTSPIYSRELPVPESDILKGISSKTSKPFAWNLLQAMKMNEAIRWDDSGNVVVKGVKIPRSGILRIVSDLSRNVRSSPPRGSVEVAKVLLENNDPKTIIGNPNRRQLTEQEEQSSPGDESFTSFSSPAGSVTPKHSIQFQPLYAERGSGSDGKKKKRMAI